MADRLPDGVRDAVYQRDGNSCVVCSRPAENIHHRQPAQHRTGDHTPWNLLSVCGSGTTGCHGWIEAHRAWSTHLGLLVPQAASSAGESQVWTRHGWRELYNDGLLWGPVQLVRGWRDYQDAMIDGWLATGRHTHPSGSVQDLLVQETYQAGVAVFQVESSWQRVSSLREFSDGQADDMLLWVLGITTALQRYSEELGDLVHHRSPA